MELSELVIVLSRPMEAGNVGAVCRAMKNMGLSRLRLAAPDFFESPGTLSEAGPGYGGIEAVIRARAVHAVDIWEGAETFDTLAAATADCSLVIGTTRRRGRHRKQVTLSPWEAAAFLREKPGPAALVFGNERTGLEDEEMELCNLASHIPAAGDFPSLNLSHAVQIYAYELFRLAAPAARALAAPAAAPALEAPAHAAPEARAPAAAKAPGPAHAAPEARAPAAPAAAAADRNGPDPVKGRWVPLDQAKIAVLVGEMTDKLQTLGFYKKPGREEQERFFRDLISRAGLNEWEGRYLAGIIAKAARLGGNEEAKSPLARGS
jgi:tRNA/rRNA methyltransferase/tRNA (cytidine32/uridine32-2'-O)-methyltransferase